jgi:hypothetical protein
MTDQCDCGQPIRVHNCATCGGTKCFACCPSSKTPTASEPLHNIASDPRIREYLHKVSERMCGFAISQPHRERREPATIPTTKNDQHSTHLHPSPDTEDFTKKGAKQR